MNKLKGIIAIILSVTIIGSLSACGQTSNVEPSTSSITQAELTQTQQEFNTFLDGLLKDTITNTLDAHFLFKNPTDFGIELEPTLGKIESKSQEEQLSDSKEILENLKNYNLKDLTPNQQITYRVLEDYVTSGQTDHDFYYYGNSIGYVSGLQGNLPLIFAEYKFYTEQDIKDYLILLGQFTDYFEQFGTYLREQSAKGLFGADFIADKAIEQIEGVTKNENNIFITSFKERVDAFEGIDETTRQQYIEQNKTAVKNSVVPAFSNLSSTIASLKGTGYEGGLSNTPDGKAYYEALIKQKTGSSKTVDEIYKTLEKRQRKILTRIQTLSMFDSKIIDKMQNIDFSDASAKEIMSDLIEKSKSDYPSLSHIDYQIKDVPDSLKDIFMSPAAYMVPPVDGTVENTIYVNDTIDKSSFYNTIAHEGYPGHLYQNNYFRSLGYHPIRSILDFPGYSEGWATYAENHSYSYNDVYKGNKDLIELFVINSEYGQNISCIVDIGVNYYGWDLAKTNEYLATFSLPEMPDLYNHVVSEPGNYLQYYVGYLEIEELRDAASGTLGDKFNAKEFNTVILKTGPSSFNILKEEVEQYINSKK